MTFTIDRRILAFAALVLMMHILSFWTELKHGMTSLSDRREEATKIQFIPLTDEQLQAYKTRAQIVQNDSTGRQEKPKTEAYLGERDMTYERQTVARKVDTFNRAAKGNAMQDVAQTRPTPQSKEQGKKSLKNLKLSDVGFEAMGAPQVQRQPAQMAKAGVANGDERSQGVSSTNDYVEHVALGDFTQLNTVEYKYYGFFHRIRSKLEQFWGRTLKEKADSIYRSGRSIASDDQYTTALMITLNENGEIVGVQVKSSSGVRELDDAAIESFNQAGPFPNPPAGLLVNGKATIEWGFVVKS